MALPRFLYVLQNTPFPIPLTYFKAVDAAVNNLHWEGKPTRIAMQKLVKGWYGSGIALPNIKIYYWASQLIVINQCLHAPQDEPSLRMDRHSWGERRSGSVV